MAYSSLSVRSIQEKSRAAYHNLLSYEAEQIKQEATRKALGPPYGRGAPPKLPPLAKDTSSASQSCMTTMRSVSTLRPIDEKPGHRATRSDIPQELGNLDSEPFSRAFQTPAISRKSSIGAFAASTRPSSPERDFIAAEQNPFERPNGKCYFFPLEMFIDWTDLPPLPGQGFFLKRSQMLSTGRVSEWQPCTVLFHDVSTRNFRIQLQSSEEIVPRKRLRFAHESEDSFFSVISRAESLRRSHEGFVRYFARFELALCQSRARVDDHFLRTQRSIFTKIGFDVSHETDSKVREELWDLYRRSSLKFIFDTQYFAPKAELMLHPWKQDLQRQDRWRSLMTVSSLKAHPYESSKGAIAGRFMASHIHLTRLAVYKGVTKLRWVDFYSCMEEVRSAPVRLTFRQLKAEFKNSFAKSTLVVDTTVKQLSEFIFKVLEGNIHLLPDVEKLLEDVEVALESNLQFAVKRSTERLAAFFKEYYAVLPIAGELNTRFKLLPEYILQRHNGLLNFPSQQVSEIQSIAIVKELIALLHSDWTANRLHTYSYKNFLQPLVCISIDSKWTRERMQDGKKPEYFSLSEVKWERAVRRSKASKLRPSSKAEFVESVKVNKVIHNIMLLSSECKLTDEAVECTRDLLSEEAFGWVSAGHDRLILDLTPGLCEIDGQLQKLLKAPLKNLLHIKKFAIRPSEKQRIRVRNAGSAIKAALCEIADVLQFSLYGPVALLALLREYDYLYARKFSDLFNQTVRSHVDDYAGLIREVRIALKHKELIGSCLPDSIQFGFLVVQLARIKAEGKRNAEVLAEALIRELKNEHLAILTDITSEFTSLVERLSVLPQSVEALDEMTTFLDSKEDERVMSHVKQELDKVRMIEDSLDEFHRDVDAEQCLMSRRTVAWEGELTKEKQRAVRRVQRLIPVFQEEVSKQEEMLKSSVQTMKSDMADFVTYCELQNADQYAARASDVLDRLQTLKSEVKVLKQREKILKLPESDFQELGAMESHFLSFHVFWNYASEWASAYAGWMEKPLQLIDPEMVETRFAKGLKLMERMKMEMTNNLSVMRAVQEQEEMLRGFEHTIPLIFHLRQDCLRDRHWRRIWDLLGRSTADRPDAERKSTQTLRDLLFRGISKHVKEVEIIAVESKREYEIEKICVRIDKDLKLPSVQIAPHSKYEELMTIGRLSEIKDKLHENLTTISYLAKANRHVEPFRDQLRLLELMISSQQSVVEDVHEFQELLFELYPVTKITEMCDLLPRSMVRMTEMVEYYAQQLAYFEYVRDMQNGTFSVKSELKVTFPEAISELRKVRDDIRSKLWSKQELCSRLFFLSDAQILTLLSQSNGDEPIDVSLLFPGVERLELEDHMITGICRQGSVYQLPQAVTVRMGYHSRNVEEWVSELEHSIKDLRSQQLQEKCAQKTGLQWNQHADSEVIYVSSFVYLTKTTQQLLKEDSARSQLERWCVELREMLESCVKDLQPKTDRSKDPFSMEIFKLTGFTPVPHPLNENFALLLLAFLDFLQMMLAGEDEDFEMQWKAAFKLREATGDVFGLTLDCFDCKTAFAFEPHSNEFIESVMPSPSGLRYAQHVYLTLKHGAGSLFIGDMDVDRTETLRFLAILSGRPLYCIPVTSVTPYERLLKFLLGCAIGGFWGCFEEVHTLPMLHLATLAKYAEIITAALAPMPARVTIDAFQIKPKPGFAMFGTATKFESPTSVRSMLRVVAVAKPDLSVTAAMLLLTSGMSNSKKCARLIAHTIEELSHPLLSLSCGATLCLHLKPNIRTLLRVVDAFVALRRETSIEDLDYLLNNTFRSIYGVGLSAKELQVFDECLATLFHSLHNDKLSHMSVPRSTTEVIARLVAAEPVLKPELLQRRCQQLFTLVSQLTWPWVIVAGATNSGKTTTIALVAKATALLAGTGFKVHKIGPVFSQSSLVELYRHLQEGSASKFEPAFQGKYCSIDAGSGAASYSSRDWIHVDSQEIPYSSNLLFWLAKPRPWSGVRLIFETESLEGIDPATLSESGLIHLEDSEVDVFDFYMSTMAQVCGEDVKVFLPGLEMLYEELMLPAIKYYHRTEKTMQVDSKFLVQAFGRLLKPYLALIKKKEKLEGVGKETPRCKGALKILMRSQTVFTPKQVIAEKRKETFFARAEAVSVDVPEATSAAKPKIKPQMVLEAVYLVSLVNSFSNFLVDADAFSVMLIDILKTLGGEFARSVLREISVLRAKSLLELTFSIKEMNWTLLTSIFSAKLQTVGKNSARRGEEIQKPEGSLSYLESIACKFAPSERHGELLIPTFSTQRISYWIEFCFRNKIDIAVFGPHQCGKSTITMTVAKELLGLGFLGLIPVNVSKHMDCGAVQVLFEAAMESRRHRQFGGVGGAHFYAVLDDMNLDGSSSLYDLFRFWKEAGGWYSSTFAGVSDLTVAFVHSYVEQRSRPMWLRAMKHFLMLHKPAYVRSELTSIFKQHIDYASVDEVEGMLSVAEESVRTLVGLYEELSEMHSDTEQIWVQVAISNFSMGLKFLAQCDMDEGVDIPQYLRLWSFMFTRFFFEQFGGQDHPVKAAVQRNLKGLIDKFTESESDAREILHRGVFLPAEDQLDVEKPFSQFELLTQDTLDPMIALFRQSQEHATELYPQRLKHLHKLLLGVEVRLSVYLSFYMSTIFDINSACSSVIVRTQSQSGLIKALAYMAADTLKVKVFEFNAEEKEDVFSSTMMETFKSFSTSYFPTEPRFEVKRIMEEAMLADKRVLVLFTLQGQDFDRPLTRRYMEIALDIVTGVKLRLSGFTNYYKEFVDKYRAGQGSKLYNDEILQILLTRMKTNVTLLFVVASEEDAWVRSPLHGKGLLEQFKHEYRTIFNKSRIVDFSNMHPPAALVQVVSANSDFVQEWSLSYYPSLLREVGEHLETAAGVSCEEFTYECVAYICEQLLRTVSAQHNKKNQTLSRGISQITKIQSEVSHLEARVATMKEELSRTEERLERKKQKLRDSQAALAAALAHPYEVDMREELKERRALVAADLAQVREAWETAIDEAGAGMEDLADAEKLMGHPSCAKVWGGFYALIGLKGEAAEGVLRKFVIQVARKWKDYSKKLKAYIGDALPDVTLESSDLTPHSRTSRPTRLVLDLLLAAQRLKTAWSRFSEASQGLDSEQADIPARAADMKARVQAQAEAVHIKIAAKVAQLDNEVRTLQQQIDYALDKKADLLDFAQDLQSVKEAWVKVLAQNDQQVAFHDCLLASFYIQKGLHFSRSKRKAVWKAMSRALVDCHADSENLTPMLMADFPQFAYNCVRMELTDSAFFMESAAFLRLIIDLKLPFPLIYDPYDVAFNYLRRLEADKALLVGEVSSDSDFERKFRDCINEGKPVVCHNPSQSLFKAVFPAIFWRAQSFLMTLRGLDASRYTMKITQKSVSVHPDFRLYICYTESAPAPIAQHMTEVNFDAGDQESWEGLLVVPVLKSLDDAQYRLYLEKELQTVQCSMAMRDNETAFLENLLRSNPQQILTSEKMFEMLCAGCRQLEFGIYGQRRDSVLGKRGVIGRRVSAINPDIELLIGPRDKLAKLLKEFYGLKNALETLQGSLEDYFISGQVLFDTILNALKEYIRVIQVPIESQWEQLADSLLYNVYVRISHSLSREKRHVLASFFAIYKSYSLESTDSQELFRVLEDVFSAISGAADTNIAYLASRYPSLFPANFTIGSPAFQLFLERDLFHEASLPHSFSTLHKFLLYSRLRPDLLPKYTETMMTEVLGARYSNIAEVDLSIHVTGVATKPTVLVYEHTSPLLCLRQMSAYRKVPLVETQPMLNSVLKAGRPEMRGIGWASEFVINCINSNFGSSCWVVVQNLDLVTGLEAEVIVKFLLTKMAENTNEAFRVFLLFRGRPQSHPEYLKLIYQCLRIVLPEPNSIKEYLTQWYSATNLAFFTTHCEAQNRSFWAGCALDPIPALKPTKKRRAVDECNPEQSVKSAFSAAFLCATLYLRSQHRTDVTAEWSVIEAKEAFDDFFSSIGPFVRPAAFSHFATLLAPQLGHLAAGAFESLAQQAFEKNRVVIVGERVARMSPVEYPLQEPKAIALYPAEDHLLVSGLSHSLAAEEARAHVPEIVSAVATLPLTLTKEGLLAARDIGEGAEKERTVDRLKSIISELIKVLPEASEEASTKLPCVNYQDRKKNWLGKGKSPVKPKDAKDVDLRNSILDEPPSIAVTLEAIHTAERERRATFLKNVRRSLVEMLRFLSYSRSLLSPEDMKSLAELARERVPPKWLGFGPSGLTDLNQWKRRIVHCFEKQPEDGLLDLTKLFAPDVALKALLRAYALAHQLQAEERTVQSSDSSFFTEQAPLPAARVTLHSTGFQVAFKRDAEPLQVCGLLMLAGQISKGVLEDCGQPLDLQTLVLTPITLPKSVSRNPAYPPGLKLIWSGSEQRPASDDLSRHEDSSKPAKEKVLVYVPVEISASALWLLLSSQEPQSYWSKRGTTITLSRTW